MVNMSLTSKRLQYHRINLLYCLKLPNNVSYDKTYPFSPDCIRIIRFMADATEKLQQLDSDYDLYFNPIQIAVALKKKSSNGIRKNMALLFLKGYLKKHKFTDNNRTTALYKMTIDQYNTWVEDEKHFVRLNGNQFGTRIRKVVIQ